MTKSEEGRKRVTAMLNGKQKGSMSRSRDSGTEVGDTATKMVRDDSESMLHADQSHLNCCFSESRCPSHSNLKLARCDAQCPRRGVCQPARGTFLHSH